MESSLRHPQTTDHDLFDLIKFDCCYLVHENIQEFGEGAIVIVGLCCYDIVLVYIGHYGPINTVGTKIVGTLFRNY